MPTVLENRLREASIEPSSAQVELLGAAVDRIVAAKKPPGVADLVTRVRLAHRLPVQDDQLDTFVAQLNRGDAAVVENRSDRQLIGLLAACTLIGRFAKQDPLRATAAIPAMTIAALAIRTLRSSGAEAIHPDLVSWAGYWLDFQGRQLREAGASAPPRPPGRPTAAEGEAESSLRGREIDALFGRSDELGDWLESAAGSAGVAVLREQTMTLWWLNGAVLAASPTEVAFRSALELEAISLSPPSPARREFLRRRLGKAGEAKVDPDRFAELCAAEPDLSRDVEVIGDLIPLLTEGLQDSASAVELASRLYDEMALTRLLRSVFEQAARHAAEAKAENGASEGGAEQ